MYIHWFCKQDFFCKWKWTCETTIVCPILSCELNSEPVTWVNHAPLPPLCKLNCVQIYQAHRNFWQIAIRYVLWNWKLRCFSENFSASNHLREVTKTFLRKFNYFCEIFAKMHFLVFILILILIQILGIFSGRKHISIEHFLSQTNSFPILSGHKWVREAQIRSAVEEVFDFSPCFSLTN